MSMCQIKTKTVHWYSFIYHFLWTAKVHVLYINVYTLRLFGWEREGVKQRPHTVCVLMPLSLPNIVRCNNIGKHKFPHLLQYRITLGIIAWFFLGNTMFRESERSANIMATTEHSIHPNLNIPKNVALGS